MVLGWGKQVEPMADHTMQDIDRFLALRRIAMPGLSREARHFSRALAREFRARGYEVIPVNPQAEVIDDVRCYGSVQAIEPKPEGALIITAAAQTLGVIQDCHAAGVNEVWLYRAGGQGAVSEEAVKWARDHGMHVIAGECPFMYLPNRAWFHSVHRGLRWMTGQLPK